MLSRSVSSVALQLVTRGVLTLSAPCSVHGVKALADELTVTLAAVDLLRELLPALRVRVVNVVDLMALQPPSAHPHGISDADFDSIFTRDSPVVFAFHGYPWMVHRLVYRRAGHANFHVHGYREEGSTTTLFDMTVLNRLDRFHLAADAIDQVPRLRDAAGHVRQILRDRLLMHRAWIEAHGEDMPEILNWRWGG